MSSKKRLLQLFGLPDDEIIFEDFSCAFSEGILKHGRMFIAENYICFYATVLGLKTKKVIKVADIQDIKKEAVLGFFNNAIQIETVDKKSYFFCSFWNRERAFSLLYEVWKREPIRDSGKGSDEEDNGSENIGQAENLVVEQSDVEILNTDVSEENQEILKCILPVSVDQFFEKFISDNAIFSFGNHMEKKGATEIKIPEWKLNEELGCYIRECTMVIKVQGVPLRDTSRLQKIQSYKREGETLVILGTTKVLDIPYAGYFTTEEKWEISPSEGSTEKSILVCKGWVNFNKSTLMKKTITQRSQQGLKEDIDIWIGRITKILQKKNEDNQTNKTQQFEQVLTKNELSLSKTQPIAPVTKKPTKPAGTLKGSEEYKRISMSINLLIALLGFIILLIALDILIFNNTVSKIEDRIQGVENTLQIITQQLLQMQQQQQSPQAQLLANQNNVIKTSQNFDL